MTGRVQEPSWIACRDDFEPEGSLRDIYVEQTALADWDRLLDWLRSSSFAISFGHEGHMMPLPTTAREVFALSGTASSILTIQVGALSINCHFFSDDEIEMDLDPKQLTDERSFALLLGFVRDLGDALNRDVIVTHENFKTAVLLRYSSRTRQLRREPHVAPEAG